MKGFYYTLSRERYIVVNGQLRRRDQLMVAAHELGHDRLHRKLARVSPLKDFAFYEIASQTEYEANLFASELLISDEDVEECISQDLDYLTMCKTLSFHPQLVSFKLYGIMRRGYRLNLPEGLDSRFMGKQVIKRKGVDTKMDNSPALKIPDESEEESERYENVIQRAESLLRNGQALKAAAVLKPLLSESSEKYEDNDRVLYRDFNDLIETVLYLIIYNPSKSIVMPPVNRSELYRVYGYAMVYLKRFEDAKISLEMAVRLNPVGLRAIFEYSDLLKRTRNFQAMRFWTRQCLRFAYLPSQIAQAYRNYGYEFIERKEFRKAAALYYVSLCYEQNQQATSELFYIMQMTGKKPEEPTPEEVKTIFKEENIQYGPGAPAVSALLRAAEHFEKDGVMERARKYYGMLYDLTHDASVKDKLEQ